MVSLLIKKLFCKLFILDEATNFPTEPLLPHEYVQSRPPLPEAASSEINILLPPPTEELPHIHISSGELDLQINSTDLGTGVITLSETFQHNVSLTDQNIDESLANIVFESAKNFYMME